MNDNKGLPIIGRLYRSRCRDRPDISTLSYHHVVKLSHDVDGFFTGVTGQFLITTGSWVVFTRHRTIELPALHLPDARRWFYTDILYDGKVYEYVELKRSSWRDEFASSDHGEKKTS